MSFRDAWGTIHFTGQMDCNVYVDVVSGDSPMLAMKETDSGSGPFR